LKVKIPIQLIDLACSQRFIVNRYETNHTIKIIGNYCLLKTLSTTGVVHISSNKKNLLSLLKLTRNSLAPALERMKIIGLIKIEDDKIILCGWKKAVEIFEYTFDEKFIEIDYNELDLKKKIDFYIYSCEIAISQQKQREALQKILTANPVIKKDVANIISGFNKQPLDDIMNWSNQQFIATWFRLQRFLFKTGTEVLESVWAYRADVNRTINSIRQSWSMKSFKSVTYTKRKLNKAGVIVIEKIGTLLSTGNFRIRQASKKYSNNFIKHESTHTWNLPDQLHVNFNYSL
jgi:hypothetical protein